MDLALPDLEQDIDVGLAGSRQDFGPDLRLAESPAPAEREQGIPVLEDEGGIDGLSLAV